MTENHQDNNRAIKEAKNAYLREWRKKNPDRARAISDRYWKKRAEKERQLSDQGKRADADEEATS